MTPDMHLQNRGSSPVDKRGVDVRERLRSIIIWQMSSLSLPVQTGNGI